MVEAHVPPKNILKIKILYVKPLPCHKLEDEDNSEHQQGDAKVLKLKAA